MGDSLRKMNRSDFGAIVLSVTSIAIGLIGIISEQYRVLIISIFSVFLVGYSLLILYAKVESNTKEVRKLNEKIKIYESMIDIKAKIKSLEREVFEKINKRGVSDQDVLKFITTAAALALLYLIYKAIMAQLGN